MARKRTEIEADIKKLTAVQARITGDLAQLKQQESDALARFGDELLTATNPKLSEDLAKIRIRKEIVNLEFQTCQAKLEGLRQEIADIEAAEALRPWLDFQDTLPTRVGNVRSLIAGLRAAMDGLKQDLDNLSSLAARTSQDSAISHQGLSQICVNGSKELADLWKEIDEFAKAHLKE